MFATPGISVVLESCTWLWTRLFHWRSTSGGLVVRNRWSFCSGPVDCPTIDGRPRVECLKRGFFKFYKELILKWELGYSRPFHLYSPLSDDYNLVLLQHWRPQKPQQSRLQGAWGLNSPSVWLGSWLLAVLFGLCESSPDSHLAALLVLLLSTQPGFLKLPPRASIADHWSS